MAIAARLRSLSHPCLTMPLIIYIARERLIPGRAPPLQIFNTLRGLCDAGADVRFVTPWPAWMVKRRFAALTGYAVPANLRVVSVGPGPDVPVLRHLWPTTHWPGLRERLRRYLRTVEPGAVVYTRNRQVAADCAGGEMPPVVFECHEFRSRTARELSKKDDDASLVRAIAEQEERALRNIAVLAPLTRCLADDLRAAHPWFDRPVHVVPDAVDPAVFAVSPAERRPTPGQFVYVGTLLPWKGLDVAVRALAQVPQATLDVCGGRRGSKDWDALVALAREQGVLDRITLHGSLPQRALRPILARATAGLLPLNGAYAIAARYTSPLKLFEYLSAGLPVVASDLPSVREIVAHDREGLLFTDRDATSLGAQLRRLIDDPPLAARLSVAASDRAGAFTWTRRAQRIIAACGAAIGT